MSPHTAAGAAGVTPGVCPTKPRPHLVTAGVTPLTLHPQAREQRPREVDAQQRLLPWAQPFSGLKPGPSWATALCTCHRAQHPGVQACEALRPSRAPEQQSTALRSVIATELGLGLPWAGSYRRAAENCPEASGSLVPLSSRPAGTGRPQPGPFLAFQSAFQSPGQLSAPPFTTVSEI